MKRRISAFYEGQEEISYERNKDYTYKDERYGSHVDAKQKYLMQHVIERIRSIEFDLEKEVVLISNIDLDFPTKKMTFKELFKMKGLSMNDYTYTFEYKFLKKLQKKYDGKAKWNNLRNDVRNLKGIKKSPIEIRDYLIKLKCVKLSTKSKVYSKTMKEIINIEIIDLGIKWIENVEKNMVKF